MGIAYVSIFLALIKEILQALFYLAGIFVAYKGIHALNIYINKNSE